MNSSDKQKDISHAQQLLSQLRASFLSELPDRCDAMEALALSLGSKADGHDNFNELYRNVHSLKGSGGTHGISMISMICHQLEDHLEHYDGDFGRIDDEFITVCLSYLDLVRQAAQAASETSPDYKKTEDELGRLQQNILAEKRLGLLVESSPVMSMMCKVALEQLPVQLITANDGLVALERLLQQKFDFLLMGKELNTLNGVALSCALRKSESENRNIKIIMLTSESRNEIATDADFVIRKDTRLTENLRDAVKKILV